MREINCTCSSVAALRSASRAARYDKLVESFAAFPPLACIRLWIKFVHPTS